jgi:ABC-type sugar transport system ATPase subunit
MALAMGDITIRVELRFLNNMAYLEITGLPLRASEDDFGPTVNLALDKGRGLSLLSSDGFLPGAVADALTGYGRFSGEIFLNNMRIDPMPVRNRSVRILGDSSGIFPRLTVKENLELALKDRAVTDTESIFMVDRELTESLLAGMDKVKAGTLDAYGRTILAAARALLTGCDLLVITALPVPGPDNTGDLNWHPGLQIDALLDLKNMLRRHNATWVSVLTDPACVHILSDRVAIFSGGNLVQEGSLRECLNAPRSRMVADFLAFPKMNYKTMRVEFDGPFLILRSGRYGFRVSEFAKRHLAVKQGDEIILGLRSEHIGVRAYETGDPTVINLAKVIRVDFIPGMQIVRLDLEGEEWTALTDMNRYITTGQLMELRPDPDKLHLFHPAHGNSLLD